MNPIAFNYLGQIVFSDNEGRRYAGKSAKATTQETEEKPFIFLRAHPEHAESVWLCAVAFVFQPETRTLPIDEFFKIVSQHLSLSERQILLPLFVVDALHAFYRYNSQHLDSPKANCEAFNLLTEHFDRLRLDKAISKIPAIASIASPTSVLSLRAAARQKKLPATTLVEPWFDPFDQTENQATLPAILPAKLPWSVQPGTRIGQDHLCSSEKLLLTGFSTTAENNQLHIILASQTISFQPSEALSILAESHSTTINDTDRHVYAPIGNADPSSALSSSLAIAHKKYKQRIGSQANEWDTYVAQQIGVSIEKLRSSLSAEQIDAVGIAIRSFSERKSFILADETGLGKGRALAALAKAFILLGKKVTFITEKKHLFSDFWRDLNAIFEATDLPQPFLLHPHGRIIGNQGDVIARSLPSTKYKQELANGNPQCDILFTTYSQFNRDAPTSDKHTYLMKHLKGSLLILDESHNASGQSQTRGNIFKFIENAAKCIFSSATYAKHEQAFELYSSATPLSKNEMALLLASFNGADPYAASNSIARGLVESGNMVRREHLPESDANSLLVQPDPADGPEIETRRTAFHEALETLFTLQNTIDNAKARAGEDTSPAWFSLGGVLSRLSKQFNLLSKIDTACILAIKLLKQGKKPVLALESTFETFAKAQISWANDKRAPILLENDDHEDDDEDGKPPQKSIAGNHLHFQALFKLVVDTIAPVELLSKYRDPAISEAKSHAFSAATNLPDWLASPIDLLISQLTSAGFKTGEISGRAITMHPQVDGTISLQPRDKDQRELLVHQFNHGQLDALIITQAGASGISLHAAPEFTDQRQRAFIELEICANPSVRVQFLGRVRRKGQTSQPEYYVVSSGSPYEHRLIERATSKQKLLSSLTSATSNVSAGGIELLQRVMTPKGDLICLEWLKFNPDLARILGISAKSSDGQPNDSIAERFLKRLPILRPEQQDDAFDFITSAINIDQIIPLPTASTQYIEHPLLVRSAPIWGPATAMATAERPQIFEPVVFLQEWLCTPPIGNMGINEFNKRLDNQLDYRLAHTLQILDKTIAHKFKQTIYPEDRARLVDLQNAARHIKPGARIRITHPYTHRPLDGVITSADAPTNPDWILAPTQWSIAAAFPGQPFVISISLATFFHDTNAYIEPSTLPPEKAWSAYQPKPLHFSTIAGHCGYSRWYAAQMAAKQSAHFIDSTGNEHEENLVDSESTIEIVNDWKIPLIDPRLTLQLLQRDTTLVLDNSPLINGAATATLRPVAGGWYLTLARAFHDQIVDYNLERRLGKRQYHNEASGEYVSRFISMKDIHATIPLLHTRQCRFFAPSTRKKWHATALELLLATAKPARNTRKR